MKQDNIEVLDPSVPPNSLPGGGSAYMALNGAKTWGGEFEVAGEPLPGWSLSGGYTYARTEESGGARGSRSEEHTSELQSLMRISYAVFCLKKKKRKD